MSTFGSHGPFLHVAMFASGEAVPLEAIEAVANRATASFGQRAR